VPTWSYHQYGLAADSAFFRDGKVVISERDPWAMRGYQLYGEIAAQVGLTWGGSWKMQDYGHVELAPRRSRSTGLALMIPGTVNHNQSGVVDEQAVYFAG
jgi:peptidoglycan L-alanyl-D-glutamate endopeptidase CwlK